MAVGTWTPPARVNGDQKAVNTLADRPLLVRVHEVLENHTTRRFPEPRDKVVVDLVDLAGDDGTGTSPRIYIGSLWGAGAVVDGLKPFAGTGDLLPVIPKWTKAVNGGNDYITLHPIEGQVLEFAKQWDARNPGAVDQARTRKMAEAEQAQAAQGAPAQMNQPPVPQLAGLGNQAPAQAQGPFQPQAQATQAPAQPAQAGPFQQAQAQAPFSGDQAQAALAQLNAG